MSIPVTSHNLELLRQLSLSLENLLPDLDSLKPRIPCDVITLSEWKRIDRGHSPLRLLLEQLYMKQRLQELTRALASLGYSAVVQAITQSSAGPLFCTADADEAPTIYDLARVFAQLGGGGLGVMHLEAEFGVRPLIDAGITQDAHNWTLPVYCTFLGRIRGRCGERRFNDGMLNITRPGGSMPCHDVHARLLRATPMLPGPRPNLAITDVKAGFARPKITSWKPYFAGWGASTIGKTDAHTTDVLRANDDRVCGLSIFKRLVNTLGLTLPAAPPGGSALEVLLDEVPFVAPFVHACLVLEDVRTEWRSAPAEQLMSAAQQQLLAAMPLHMLVGLDDDTAVVNALRSYPDLTAALVSNLLAEDPAYCTSRRILYSKPGLICDFHAVSEARKQRFMQLFAEHVDPTQPGCRPAWCQRDTDILAAYHKQAAELAPVLACEPAPAADAWIHDWVRAIDIDDDERDVLAGFLRKQKVRRTHLRDLTQADLQQLTDLPLGSIKEVLRACAQ